MKKINGVLFASVSLLLLLSSCVSQKKYQTSLDREQQLMADISRMNNNITDLHNRIDSLDAERKRVEQQREDAKKNAASLAGLANMTQQQLESEQRRLAEMRTLVDKQRQLTENLRKKMSDALVGFNSNELTINTKNGKVYVSLQENLLFPSGSAVVNTKGKEALGKLAQVLNNNPDIGVMIEGHTDSIPIRGRYEDNWALSVARATSIVRILTNTYNVDATRVTASGKSYFDPVDSNSTPEGRAKNRRTEIILAPKLDELMQLLEQSPEASTE